MSGRSTGRARQRLAPRERRALFVSAARRVFAEKGLDGASTREIAREAGVSEGLLYRYFASKEELHAEVLRQIGKEQEHSFAVVGDLPPSSHNLIERIVRYLRLCLSTGEDRPSVEHYRFMLWSFAGNGDYARLAFERAMRRSAPDFGAAMGAARRAGDLTGTMAARNANWFVEHVGIMLIFGHLPDRPVIRYDGDEETLLRDAVRYCARGIGLSDAAIDAYWKSCGSRAGAKEEPRGPVSGRKPKRTRAA